MAKEKIKMSEVIANKKNLKRYKIATIVFVFLFFIFSVKNCNNSMKLDKISSEKEYVIDSIKNESVQKETILIEKINKATDSIKTLNYELKMALRDKVSAEKQVEAVQTTVDKINRNTTIRIESRSEKDSVSLENK